MPKERKCPECERKMRSKRFHLVLELDRKKDQKNKKDGWAYKYVCKNRQCLNYLKTYDYWELEDLDLQLNFNWRYRR